MFAVLCVQYEKAGAVRTLVLLEMYKPSVICRGRLAADSTEKHWGRERESRYEGEEVVIRRKKHGDTVFFFIYLTFI